MEDLPPWPASVFEDETNLEMNKTGLLVTKNKEFKSTVKTWIDKREAILYDINNATEIVQEGLESAREFLDCKTLTESRVDVLKKQCKDHSKTMAKIADELISYKTNEFMKAYPLSLGAKEYVKEEFKRITNHMRYHQKSVNSELARILKDKEEKEIKPAPMAAPAVQPLGSGTSIQIEHDPINSYTPLIWKDWQLTMKTT